MKKFLVSIFAVFYLGLSSGAVVHLHYCMDKLIEWNLLHERKKDQCSKCGMIKSHKKNKKDCCREDVQFIKITDAQKVTDNSNSIHVYLLNATISPFIESTVSFIPDIVQKYSFIHPPPKIKGSGIYLLNCIFRV